MGLEPGLPARQQGPAADRHPARNRRNFREGGELLLDAGAFASDANGRAVFMRWLGKTFGCPSNAESWWRRTEFPPAQHLLMWANDLEAGM